MDQKGLGANLQETRLYTYADDERGKLYLLKLAIRTASIPT